MSVPRHGRRNVRPSQLMVLFLCAIMALASWPMAHAAMPSPGAQQPGAETVNQEAAVPLVAFLRDGQIWLMNPDGTDQRQVTNGLMQATANSWSPSGQHLMVYSGGGFIEGGGWEDRVVSIYSVASGELRDIARFPASPSGVTLAGPPVWAGDADELLVSLRVDGESYSLHHLAQDGTLTKLAYYSNPETCGGPDGPFLVPQQMAFQQEGGFFASQIYQPLAWYVSTQVAHVNLACLNGTKTVGLFAPAGSEFPEAITGAGPHGILLRESGGAHQPAMFILVDAVTGERRALQPGQIGSMGADGSLFLTRTIEGAPSAFTSRFDDVPATHTDRTVELWRTDISGTEPALVASLPAFTMGVPQVAPDGSYVIAGVTGNPSDLMDVDESGADRYSDRLYAHHQRAVRIDTATGTVETIATDALRPALQPVAAAAIDVAAAPVMDVPSAPVTAIGDYEFQIPMVAWQCQERPISFGTVEGPPGCELAGGLIFTVSGPAGEVYGSCRASEGGSVCSVPAPAEVALTVTVYEASVPEGYVVDQNPLTVQLRAVPNDADAARFVLLPGDVAGGQPGSDPGATPGEPEPVPTDAASVPAPGAGSGEGWIAYVGADGNIWLTQPDGSAHHQVTTDGTLDHHYAYPSWSHDGSMLAFSRPAIPDSDLPSSIYLLRDGSVSQVPNVYGCDAAAFMPGDQELAMTCGHSSGAEFATDGELQSNPAMGLISMAGLDGSNWRVHVPYSGDVSRMVRVGISVSADGAIMYNWSSSLSSRMSWIAPGSTEIHMVDASGSIQGRFAPGSQDFVATLCPGCYQFSRELPNQSLAIVDRSGTVTRMLLLANPEDLLGVPTLSPDQSTVAYTVRWDSWPAYGDIVRLDLATFEQSTIAQGMQPAWQPVSADIGLSGADVPVPTDETTAPESPLAIGPGEDWIAYVGDDGNIWLMKPDGSDQWQVTTDGRIENGPPTYDSPVWSHDGTSLAFIQRPMPNGVSGIWLLRHETLSLVPGTDNCAAPAFSADNQRILYHCSSIPNDPATPIPPDLATNPRLGFVSSSALDGSDQRLEIPYTGQDLPLRWGDGKAMLSPRQIDVRSSDGMMLVTYGGFRKAGALLFDANGVHLGSFEMPGELGHGMGPGQARFTPDGQVILATWCVAGCLPHAGNAPVDDILILDLQGNTIEEKTQHFPGLTIHGVSMSPDGSSLVFGRLHLSSDDPEIHVLGPAGQTFLVFGDEPAWQPAPSP